MNKLKCDFCTTGEVRYAYPCEDFVVNVIGFSNTDLTVLAAPMGFKQDWAACEICHALIEANDRERLMTRSLELFDAKYGLKDEIERAMIQRMIELTQTQFFLHRKGAPTRVQ